ncbi:MAG: hypothetical protein KatS3mg109_0299 [Pirellulaceae bacterium]|nr:MAG: hypothetical protein KatS3mg109_0299 [Pirellulaceae bacterium]
MEQQFLVVQRIVKRLSRKKELPTPLDVHVLHAGGVLKALAIRFLGRNCVVIYADVLELAYENGEPVLAFVVAHELAHVKRKHLSKRWLPYPVMFVPLLGHPIRGRAKTPATGSLHLPEGWRVLRPGRPCRRKKGPTAT